MMRADVVVVGAGPAGSTTATLLARDGFDVLLLDRHVFPRPKPCGDCLSPNVTRLLDRLGALPAVCSAGPARLHGWRIVSRNGCSFETRFDEVTADPAMTTALAIRRDRLDALLLDCARAAGVRVRTGTHVTDLRDGARGVTGRGADGEAFVVEARLTVGADGLRSVVARRARAIRRRARLRKVSLTAHVRGVDADTELGEMHLADGLCAGLAPVTADPRVACNLTLVADAARFGRVLACDPHAFFRTAVREFPRLAARLGPGFEPPRELLASGPFDVPVRYAAAPGLALVGDAAGYYDPFTGQGVNQAIHGAFLLAAEAARALREDPDGPLLLRRYDRRLRRTVRGVRAVQRMIEFVLSRAGLGDRIIARLARRPDAARALIAATGDIAPARSVVSPAALLALAGPAVSEDSV